MRSLRLSGEKTGVTGGGKCVIMISEDAMNTINLKNIVPDLKGRCKKLEKTYKILFQFSLLIIPAVPTMIVMQKYGVCAQLCRIVDMISMRDIVPLITVFGYASNAADAARKLIETGNLKGYRLVADTVLVKEIKDGVELSEEEAIRSYAALFSPVAAATAGVSPSDMPAAMKKAAELYAANEAAMFRQAGQTAPLAQDTPPAQAAPPANPAEDPAPACPECGAPLSSTANFCSECGAPAPSAKD